MGHRILIIDDHPETLELMGEIFSEEGHDVVSLRSVSPDLAAIHEAGAELVIVDLRLAVDGGQLSGWDIVRLIKANEGLRSTRVLVISADARGLREHAVEAARMDGVQLLAKPFGLDALLAMVADALRGSDQSQHAARFDGQQPPPDPRRPA